MNHVIACDIETDYTFEDLVPFDLQEYYDDDITIRKMFKQKASERKKRYKWIKLTPIKFVGSQIPDIPIPEPRTIVIEQPVAKKEQKPLIRKKSNFFDF